MSTSTQPATLPKTRAAEPQPRVFRIPGPGLGRKDSRRVLFVNSYGGPGLYHRIERGEAPGHHLWGCLQLAERGYEVGLAEVLPHRFKDPFPHDLRLLSAIREWLRPDDILFSGHTLLYYTLLLKKLGLVRCRIVSQTFAREQLEFAKWHDAVVAMTPAALGQARLKAPRVPVRHLSWGNDLDFFPSLPYEPVEFFSCGITNRDFKTLSAASSLCGRPVRVICPGLPQGVTWPKNVEVINGGTGWNTDEKRVSFRQLVTEHYKRCAASLIILQPDAEEKTANGFTNLLEAMAMRVPVIMTRTGAVPGEVDIDKEGCGISVPAGDARALAEAMTKLAEDPIRARQMGEKGRLLAETRYNIDRFADDLHAFFESI